MKVTFFISILLLLAAAAAVQMRPASFDQEEPKRRFADRIAFPDVKSNASNMVLCFSQIEKSGKMTDTGCYVKDNFDTEFVKAIIKASKKSTLTPAVINGEKRKVYLQFRVEFIAKDDDRQIKLYLNPGNTENVEAYGADHIAAQRAIGKEPWQSVCPQRAKYLVLVRAYVGEDGMSANPSLERVSGIMPTADCQNAIKETILQSVFMPAMADGDPVPSAYVESFSN